MTPVTALAQPNFAGQIVPNCVGGNGLPLTACGFCNLVDLAENIIQFLVFFAVVVAILMIIYAGFLYLTAAADPGQAARAKRVFWVTILGLTLTLAAWLIVDVIMTTFLSGNILRDLSGNWADLPGC